MASPAKAKAYPTRRILRGSWAVGAVVLLAGILLIVAPAIRHAGPLFDNPFVGQLQQRTVETLDANGVRTGTVITTEPAGSWLDRSLGVGGILLVKIAIAAVLAFLAAALFHRAATGSFPSKVGPMEFLEKTGAGFEELTRTLANQLTELEALRADVERVSEAGADGVAAVAKLNRRLNRVGERQDSLETAMVRLTAGLGELVAAAETPKRRTPKAQ
jgi:hypothetical protein